MPTVFDNCIGIRLYIYIYLKTQKAHSVIVFSQYQHWIFSDGVVNTQILSLQYSLLAVFFFSFKLATGP